MEATQDISTKEAKMKRLRKRCSGDCPGHPRPERVSQSFTRRGSRVEVIISRIPAQVCPLCNLSFLDEETSRRIALLLLPFHGTRGQVPDLPPAKIYIDFEEAGSSQKAA